MLLGAVTPMPPHSVLNPKMAEPAGHCAQQSDQPDCKLSLRECSSGREQAPQGGFGLGHGTARVGVQSAPGREPRAGGGAPWLGHGRFGECSERGKMSGLRLHLRRAGTLARRGLQGSLAPVGIRGAHIRTRRQERWKLKALDLVWIGSVFRFPAVSD